MTYVERSLVRSVLGFVSEPKEHMGCLVCMFDYIAQPMRCWGHRQKKNLKVNVIPGQSSPHMDKKKYNLLVKGANWTLI